MDDWLNSDDGKDWLTHAPLEELCGRQSYLNHHPEIPDRHAEYDLIEAAIRGESMLEYTRRCNAEHEDDLAEAAE